MQSPRKKEEEKAGQAGLQRGMLGSSSLMFETTAGRGRGRWEVGGPEKVDVVTAESKGVTAGEIKLARWPVLHGDREMDGDICLPWPR